MPDPIVKLVVDCSVPDRAAVVAYTQDQVEAVLAARVKGDLSSEEAAAKLVELAELAAAAADIPDRVTTVELDGEELAEYHERQASAADDAVTATAAQTARDELVAKLRGGTAQPKEIQDALATIIGGVPERDPATASPRV